MAEITLERLAWWLAWSYAVNASVMVCYAVIMLMAFLQFRASHMVTALMAMLAGALMFSGLGIAAFNRPYDPILLVSRVPSAILSIALLAHTFVSGVEEWNRRHGEAERSGGDTERTRKRLQEQIARLRAEREKETDETKREQLRYWIDSLCLQLEELESRK